MNNNKRDKDNKSLITEFTNEWLRLRARFQVEDLFIDLQMLKFSYNGSMLLHNILQICCARPPCSDACMLPQTPLTNMTKRPLKT
jgi:hypothetical protein